MTQVRRNLVTNILSLFVNIFVGIFYTPYLVKNLGVAAYGVIPLSLLLNQYINILANSLTRAVTRFFSVEYKAGNYKQASAYFTTSIVFTVILAFILIPVCCIPIYYLENLLDIPQQLLFSSKWLFVLSVVAFFVSVVCNCVNITIFANNRLDLINYVKIVRHIAKLFLNVVLFVLFGANLLWVGVAFLLSEIAALVVSAVIYKSTKQEGVFFSLSLFQPNMVRPIYSMIMWIALISFADTFIYKIDSLLVTNYFGLESTGILGSMSEFGSYCISVTAIIGSLFSPIILIAYSEGRHLDVKRLAIDGGFVVGVISCILCGMVMGFSKPILNIWLNEHIAENFLWMVIKLSVIPFTTVGAVYACVYNYWNKVRLPAIISLTIAFLYILLGVLMLEKGVAILPFLAFNAIAVVAQGFIMNAYIFVSIYKDVRLQIVRNLFRLLLFFFCVYFICCGVEYIMPINSLLQLAVTFLILGTVIAFGCLFQLKKEEQDMLNLLLPIDSFLKKLHIKKS